VRRSWALAALLVAGCGAKASPPAAQPPNTATVEQGELSALVSLPGILAYRAAADGAPHSAINHARGTYTKLPGEGDKVACGDVLYRVDDRPVRLICGTVPLYRSLHNGDKGKDVRELNRSLGLTGRVFTSKTRRKLRGGAATVLPGTARIAKVTATLGAPARPGAPVLQATSDTLEVQASLEPTQREDVKPGDAAQITLPDNTVVQGTVRRLGKIAKTSEQDTSASIPVAIRLAEPAQARGLDRAPVQVNVKTVGVKDALSVPVTALVGRAGGGVAVEVVRAGGRRALVAVELGLFDTTDARVQVEGEIHAGDRVVVPTL